MPHRDAKDDTAVLFSSDNDTSYFGFKKIIDIGTWISKMNALLMKRYKNENFTNRKPIQNILEKFWCTF